MVWQFNPKRGDITDPDTPIEQTSLGYDAYAYYGGDLIAESICKKDGPLLAAAPDMLAVLKSMQSVDDDPMANGDPRRVKLLAAIKKAEGWQ